MGSTKIVSPSVSLPLKNALTYVYWKKSDLKSFLAISIKNNSILATLDWDLTKYKIVSDLVDRMFSRQDIYKDDLLYLIEQICDMDDFTHLLRWDDGEEKVKKAKESVNALRKSTEGYFKRKSNEKTIAQHIMSCLTNKKILEENYLKILRAPWEIRYIIVSL